MPLHKYKDTNLSVPIAFTTFFTIAVCGTAIIVSEYAPTIRKQPWYKKSKKQLADILPMDVIQNTDAYRWWRGLSPSQKTVFVITTLNVAPLAMSYIPRISTFVRLNFALNGFNRKVVPFFLSTFTHFGLFHFGINMFALYSFSHEVVNAIGTDRFVSLYLCSGMLGSLLHHYRNLILKSPKSSIGASGCVVGVFAANALLVPDGRVSFIFLWGVTFSAINMLKSLVVIEGLLALLWKNSPLAHAAHLGGYIGGAAYLDWLSKRRKVSSQYRPWKWT